jgi:hypothetical protein
MKNQNIIFWVTIILLFLTISIVLYKNGYSKYVESMRIVPRPTIHVQQQYTPPPESNTRNNYGKGGLNELADKLIHKYFDEDLIPYSNTIDLYYEYFVNKGNLDASLKKKLCDICYYLIEVVIPNIPSVDNPNPHIEWSRIEWVAEGWESYNYSFNDDATSNFDSRNSFLRYGLGKRHKNSNDGNGLSSLSSLSSRSNFLSITPSPTVNSANSTDSLSGGGNGTTSCNSSCPIECSLTGMTAKSSKSSPFDAIVSSASKLNWWDAKIGFSNYDKNGKQHSSFSSSIYEGTSRAGTSANKWSTRSNVVYNVSVTQVQNKNTSSRWLNNYVRDQIINKWFDTASNADKPLPSKYALSIFEAYALSGISPIDRSHKNKLRDFVYYYLENIIPGLPTKDKPESYVEWRPMRHLSNSDL